MKDLPFLFSKEDLKQVIMEVFAEFTATKQPEPVEKIYYNRKETAAKIGVSLPTLWKMTKEGKIESVKVGGKVFYTVEAIDKVYQVREFKPKNL